MERERDSPTSLRVWRPGDRAYPGAGACGTGRALQIRFSRESTHNSLHDHPHSRQKSRRAQRGPSQAFWCQRRAKEISSMFLTMMKRGGGSHDAVGLVYACLFPRFAASTRSLWPIKKSFWCRRRARVQGAVLFGKDSLKAQIVCDIVSTNTLSTRNGLWHKSIREAT